MFPFRYGRRNSCGVLHTRVCRVVHVQATIQMCVLCVFWVRGREHRFAGVVVIVEGL